MRGKQGIYVGNAMVANKRPTFSCKKKTLVNTAKYFWPIGDRNNGVPLYRMYYMGRLELFRSLVSTRYPSMKCRLVTVLTSHTAETEDKLENIAQWVFVLHDCQIIKEIRQ